MGDYTEIHFNAELRRDVPDNVLSALNYMVGECEDHDALPDHPLFSTPRWPIMFRCDSYYHDADTHSTLRYDDVSGSHFLCIRSNLKNYDSEIELFVDWIDPYLDKDEGDFLGFYRCDQTEDPTLIRKRALAEGGSA